MRNRIPSTGGRPAPSASSFKNASDGAVTTRLQATFTRAFRRSRVLRDKAVTAGHIADYVAWLDTAFATPPPIVTHREELWAALADTLDPGRPLVVFEFGVAWGYSTDWWLRRLAGRDVVWHGFDRFTGLPRAWRDHAAGEYDAGGHPPAIDDPRVHWHVGDVEVTMPAVDLAAARDAAWLILFDLDLYEPTAFAWSRLAPHLRPGDLLYFDEAMDDDERRVLDELVLPAGSYRPIGTTALALGLAVTRAAAGAGGRAGAGGG